LCGLFTTISVAYPNTPICSWLAGDLNLSIIDWENRVNAHLYKRADAIAGADLASLRMCINGW